MLPFRNPPNILKFPVNGLPRFPNGPLRRETAVSEAFFYTFPSKSTVNELPSMFPIWVAMERGASSPESYHEKRGKHLVTVQGATCGRKASVKWGEAWFPKGTVYDIAISTPAPCSLQHDTFHFGLGTPQPR